jgi:hypothetical protein
MSVKLKLAFVGQPEYNSPFYETDIDDIYVVRQFSPVFDPASGYVATSATMASLLEFQPDVAIFFRPEFFSNDLLSRLRGVKIGISTEPMPKYLDGNFHYTLDSIGRFKSLLKAAELEFDHIFHYDAASLSFMERMGVRVSGAIALPVATMTWRPAEDRNADWDLVFLGRSTENRERHFGGLKRDLRFLHIAHGIIGKDVLPFYHAAKIGLNIHSEPELGWEPRIQQLMAAGLLVVSEPISPNEWLRPGEEFLEIRHPHETYEICREIVANPLKFEPIRRAGHERVQRDLTARQLWPRLIERCRQRDLPPATFDLGRVRLAPLEVCAEFNGFEHLLDQLRGEHA